MPTAAASTAVSGWTAERVETDGDAYFAAVLADITAAERQVTVEVYILEDDAIGRALVTALEAAQARGVEVHLLVDGIGSAAWISGRPETSIPWRIYHPPPWLVVGAPLPDALRFINRRNHRKVCVIDGRHAWVGSFNWERLHSRNEVGDQAWRDTAARVSGPAVSTLGRAFTTAWRQSWRSTRRKRALVPAIAWRRGLGEVEICGPVRLNANRTLRRRQWKDLLARVGQARTRVWITTPYFVPSDDLLRTLTTADAHCDVRLILPQRNDHRFMGWVASVYAERLLRAGVRIWIHPTMIHAKTWVIDDRGLVGSSNLNSRSLRFDLEADVWLDQPASVTALADAFTADCARSIEIPRSARPPWWMRLLGNTFLLMRRYL